MSIIIHGMLPIMYRVKQGALVAGRPQKQDHLTVYRNTRTTKEGYFAAADVMDKLHELFPDYNEASNEKSPGKAYVIPIRLLFDEPELNMRTHYACYDGRKIKSSAEFMTPFLKCKGNGETAKRIMGNGDIVDVPCPGPDHCHGAKYVSGGGNVVKLCKLQGVFDFELRGVSPFSGGIARYRTAGFNSASGILGQLEYYHKALGILRGLPFCIELNHNTVQAADGLLYTFQSLMLSVQGEDPMKVLGEAKVSEQELRAKTGINMIEITNLYRKLYLGDLTIDEDDTAEMTEEMPDDSGYEEYSKQSLKEMDIAENQQEKAKSTQAMMKAAKAASNGEIAQELIDATSPQDPPPADSSAAKRIKIQKENKEKYGANPSDEDMTQVFPD